MSLDEMDVRLDGMTATAPNVIDLDAITVVLAESQALFREAIDNALSSEPSLAVVELAATGAELLAAVDRWSSSVVLLDSELRGTYLIDMISSLKGCNDMCKVVVLVAEPTHEELMKALEAGADGYITKQAALSELVDAIHAVHRGEVMVPTWMLSGLLGRLMHTTQEDALRKVWDLSRREREVLSLLTQGADNQTIGEALVISPQTARTHVQNILTKLGVHSRLEAAAFVTQNNVLEELRTRA